MKTYLILIALFIMILSVQIIGVYGKCEKIEKQITAGEELKQHTIVLTNLLAQKLQLEQDQMRLELAISQGK